MAGKFLPSCKPRFLPSLCVALWNSLSQDSPRLELSNYACASQAPRGMLDLKDRAVQKIALLLFLGSFIVSNLGKSPTVSAVLPPHSKSNCFNYSSGVLSVFRGTAESSSGRHC